MKRVLVQYRVKKEKAEENKAYIKKVFMQLQEDSPEGIRYASFVQPDGVSFVHIASVETPDGKNPLSELPAFKAFQKEIKDRCEVPPTAVELIEVGTYRLF
ncbi:MAG: hypothetical protein D6748_11950 [Calditrichaeota bacterium]|nr:MAG: hypothetical protein D6748_11950 [Calditrichota bacterium]